VELPEAVKRRVDRIAGFSGLTGSLEGKRHISTSSRVILTILIILKSCQLS
jgi:hypothetical protein